MTCWLPLCSLGALPVAAFSRSPDMTKWNTVEQVCGKLEWVDEISAKKKPNDFHQKSKPLKKVAVRLWAYKNEASRCAGLTPTAETMTKGDGSFVFKCVVAGEYWMAVALPGKEYRLAIK